MIASATVFGLAGAGLVAVGTAGFVGNRHLLRRLLAFNVIGSGIFLVLGASGARDPAAGTDPVPQALIITGIVVALSATALGVALITAFSRASGLTHLPEEEGMSAASDASRDARDAPDAVRGGPEPGA